MGLERRGRVKRSHDRGNWEQEDFDACDRQAVRLACLLDGSRMSQEVYVRFCERPVVESRRPTQPGTLMRANFLFVSVLRNDNTRTKINGDWQAMPALHRHTYQAQ
jgi:hypothetical protein